MNNLGMEKKMKGRRPKTSVKKLNLEKGKMPPLAGISSVILICVKRLTLAL